MNHIRLTTLLSLALAGGLAPNATAQLEITNRVTAAFRMGLPVQARFKSTQTLALPSSPTRLTPDGKPYNYEDGYILMDFSDNAGGMSWNWGYNDSSKQDNGASILLSRTSNSPVTQESKADSDTMFGGELGYQFLLRPGQNFSFGLEVAGNYQSLSIGARSQASANITRTTYAYPYVSGTTPPGATPDAPYQGTFDGPGFLIYDTPDTPTSQTVPGATVNSHQAYEADLWGFRLGPTLQASLGRFTLGLSGGLAGVSLAGEASWNSALTYNGVAGGSNSGHGSDSDFLLGYYAAANLYWQFAERWGVFAGAQYQDVGTYSHSFSGQQVQVDLSKSIFITAGLSFSF